MDKLTKTANILDRVFRILSVCVTIGAVCCLVALVLIGACFLFGLDPYMIGNGYNSVSFGSIDLVIAQGYAPDEHFVLILVAVEAAITLICLIIARQGCGCVRRILSPMTQGEPFRGTVSANLKKLAKYSIVLCVAVNLLNIITTTMYVFGFDLAGLILSDKITGVTFLAEGDLTFLLVAGVLYLLGWVFRYGEELQQLSDETL